MVLLTSCWWSGTKPVIFLTYACNLKSKMMMKGPEFCHPKAAF